MSETTQELKLNPAKLARLVTHYQDGGDRSTDAAAQVLKIRKPNYVEAYIQEALVQAGIVGPEGEVGEAGHQGDVGVAVDGPHGEKPTPPTEEAPAQTSGEIIENGVSVGIAGSNGPGPHPSGTVGVSNSGGSAKALRFRTKDGQTIKLKIASETAKAVIFEEDVPQELVTIMLKGVPAQVNALDPTLTPEIRTAIELARS